jgi:hypothetical protein
VLKVLPSETEQELPDMWLAYLHNDRDEFPECWRRYLQTQSKEASRYELFTGDMNPLKKPWWDQEVIVFRDPNRSSIEPAATGSSSAGGDASGANPGSG